MAIGLSSNRPRYAVFYLWIIAVLIFQTGFVRSSPVLAQGSPGFLRRARVIEAERSGVRHPAGLAYAAKADAFYGIEARGQADNAAAGTAVIGLTKFWDRASTAQITEVVQDPINLVYDDRAGRLLVLQPDALQLIEVQAGADGSLDPARRARYDAQSFGLQDPRGMVIDPASGDLLILDSAGPRLVRVKPASGGRFDAAAVTVVDLQPGGLTHPRGLALDPSTGLLYLFSPANQTLVELTQAGQVLAVRDLSAFHLGSPQGMVFAPSGDQTDDPAQMNLYLADSGASADQEGQVVEFSLVDTASAKAALALDGASDFTSSLVRTKDLSTLLPPLPDPSGLAYIPSRNTLLVSDGEVDETVSSISHFRGANVWELSLSGSVISTANLSNISTPQSPAYVAMSNEPNGIAWNKNSGHVYVADDNAHAIYDLDPGDDDVIGSADDTFTSFSTLPAGSSDPEGVTYDSQNNQLFVVDGDNAEVYQYSLSGSLIRHFDVAVLGVNDPESLEYNADNNSLFVMSSNSTLLIIETSLSGTLLQTIDASVVSALAAAGLTYAPASDGSGVKHFYIVDRGVDNNTDPKIIDGKLYEMTAPGAAPSNTAPLVNAGADQMIVLTDSAVLDGTVSDDGLPNPPAALTYTWSKVSGPGTVTFANASAVDTSATFSSTGSYVLRLTASDSLLSASDTLNITVNAAPVVSAGADRIIELAGSAALDGTASDDGLPNPPGALAYTWSKVSGPGTVTFAAANAVDTSATFSLSGSYVLRLTASDGALSSSDTVNITVTPNNTAPQVNAGGDQTIELSGTAALHGTASDDDLPNPPGALTFAWSKVSGPGTVTFAQVNAADTTATFSAAGSYTLRLTASDSRLSGSDVVAVTVTLDNTAPRVNAGADQIIKVSHSAVLHAAVSDDGLPNPPGALTCTWSKVSGPGTVSFTAASALNSSASFSAAGTYVLRLTASDSRLTASDEVTVTVAPYYLYLPLLMNQSAR